MIRLPKDKQISSFTNINTHANYSALKKIVEINNDAIIKEVLRKSSPKELDILLPLLNKKFNKNEHEKFTLKTIKKWSNQAKKLNNDTLEVVGIWINKYKEKGILVLDARIRVIQYKYYKGLL